MCNPKDMAQFEDMARFAEQRLAKLWCEYNGQRGTEKQIAKVLRNLDRVSLERMLTTRGISL